MNMREEAGRRRCKRGVVIKDSSVSQTLEVFVELRNIVPQYELLDNRKL